MNCNVILNALKKAINQNNQRTADLIRSYDVQLASLANTTFNQSYISNLIWSKQWAIDGNNENNKIYYDSITILQKSGYCTTIQNSNTNNANSYNAATW